MKDLEAIHPRELVKKLKSDDRPKFHTYWKIRNELKPSDLYCYLYARFGPPNGIQNFLRGDSSENLIHWEWALNSHGRIVLIQGHNFRTEVWVTGNKLADNDLMEFTSWIQNSFPSYGKEMGKVRQSLERWVEFINPYKRIQNSMKSLKAELDALDLKNQLIKSVDFSKSETHEEWSQHWNRQVELYSKATGLCFGIRSMLPVMAEAFINLVMYLLMVPAIKKDERLRENLIRQPIDIRVKSLSHNCFGFKQNIDYNHEACREYQSLVNERNDLLHGNVVPDKLKFNKLYFNGKVPVFESYFNMWERAFGVTQSSVGMDRIEKEIGIVDNLIEYIISCLDKKYQDQVRYACEVRDLGLCLDDGHIGILFTGILVDSSPAPSNSLDRD